MSLNPNQRSGAVGDPLNPAAQSFTPGQTLRANTQSSRADDGPPETQYRAPGGPIPTGIQGDANQVRTTQKPPKKVSAVDWDSDRIRELFEQYWSRHTQ